MLKLKIFIQFILFILCGVCDRANADAFSTTCPTWCDCYFRSNNLSITCSRPQLNGNFQLPNATLLADIITQTNSIHLQNSYLQRLPSNICQYGTTLKYLDMAFNSISSNLSGRYFECINKLEILNISTNKIQFIYEDTFNYMLNLRELDLSNNLIKSITYKVFQYKLPSLTKLSLRSNLLKEIDVWFLFLKSITYIDLSSNQIYRFRNDIQWSPYYSLAYTQLTYADMVDLRYNYISKFDDDILRLFSICNINEFNYFITLFNKLRIDRNPIDCSCQSFNMLTFYQQYITVNPNQTHLNLLKLLVERLINILV